MYTHDLRIIVCGLVIGVTLSSCQQPIDKEGRAEIEGTEIYYHMIGQGEPMMILHGGPLLDQSYLYPQMKRLAANHLLIFADQRVSGRSSADVDPETMTIDQLIKDIEALRVKLKLGRMHLFGHSWGGMLAVRYAMRYPENLRSLILADPMPPTTELWRQEEKGINERITRADTLERRRIMRSEEFRNRSVRAVEKLMKLSFKIQFYDSTLLDSLQLGLPDDYFKRSEIFRHVGPELANFNLVDSLHRITTPTLIMYGDDEPGAKLSGPVYAHAIPGSTLQIIGHSGHFPFIENPEDFFSQVGAFTSAHRE